YLTGWAEAHRRLIIDEGCVYGRTRGAVDVRTTILSDHRPNQRVQRVDFPFRNHHKTGRRSRQIGKGDRAPLTAKDLLDLTDPHRHDDVAGRTPEPHQE